jgi:competence protein ComEA
MKKVITGFFISIIIIGFSSCLGAKANTAQSNYISVIANVQVVGAVKNPGIYKVPSGTRLVDVLVKAGGLRKDAVISNINLTSPVTDGVKIYISSKKEFEVKPDIVRSETTKINFNEATSIKKEKKSGRKKKVKKQEPSTKQININTASLEDLDTLPGIGKGLAKVIIKYRTKNGRFKSLEAFNNVPGIGDKKIEKLKNKIIL